VQFRIKYLMRAYTNNSFHSIAQSVAGRRGQRSTVQQSEVLCAITICWTLSIITPKQIYKLRSFKAWMNKGIFSIYVALTHSIVRLPCKCTWICHCSMLVVMQLMWKVQSWMKCYLWRKSMLVAKRT
jgi:hypothetical protein